MIFTPEDLVLWQDASLLVINKPWGLLTLPDGYDKTLPHLKSMLSPVYGRLWIVHRLDKDTSGVMLLARSAEAHRSLNTQFEQRQVLKTYHALVVGNPAWEEKVCSLPLRANGDRMHRTVIDFQRGKTAQTHLEVIERFDTHTLLAAHPQTGRLHQIRAHLAALDFPVGGDKLYGSKAVQEQALLTEWISRPALHSRSLAFNHPLTGEAVSFEALYPEDLSTALQHLRL